MNSIRSREESLFKKWEEILEKNCQSAFQKDLFCYDGLHNTGVPVQSDGHHWVIEPDYQEEQMWNESHLKCVFITKEHNLQGDNEGVDIRTETGIDNCTGRLYYRFYARYLYLLYGILHIDVERHTIPSLEEAKEHCLDYFRVAPVVRINFKKIAGGSSCSERSLRDYQSTAKDVPLLKEQLSIYQPNIIISCSGSKNDNYMWDTICGLFPKAIPVKPESSSVPSILYSIEDKLLLVKTWHPSARIKYSKYYQLVEEIAEFLFKVEK